MSINIKFIKKSINILLCLLPIFSYGQSIDVNILTNPSFQFNSAVGLEAGDGTSPYTLITNSFYLTINNDNTECDVYASIPAGITLSGGANTPMPVSNIILRFNNTNAGGNARNILTGDIPMTNGNPGTRLFSQRKRKNQSYNYYYDVALPTIGFNYAPGNYNYTFLFTMTMP